MYLSVASETEWKKKKINKMKMKRTHCATPWWREHACSHRRMNGTIKWNKSEHRWNRVPIEIDITGYYIWFKCFRRIPHTQQRRTRDRFEQQTRRQTASGRECGRWSTREQERARKQPIRILSVFISCVCLISCSCCVRVDVLGCVAHELYIYIDRINRNSHINSKAIHASILKNGYGPWNMPKRWA